MKFSHDLQIVENIWDIASNQLNKMHNIVPVILGYFTAKILHIVPLMIHPINLKFRDCQVASLHSTPNTLQCSEYITDIDKDIFIFIFTFISGL